MRVSPYTAPGLAARAVAHLLAVAAFASPLLLSTGSQATEAGKTLAQTSERTLVKAPPGFREACKRYAWLCSNRAEASQSLPPSELLSLARQINRRVNRMVSHVSDRKNHGRADYWTLPSQNRGDCEDFVLQKYKLLLDAGVDSRDLSIAVVRNGRDINHAVLILHHAVGDLVLDSLSTRILPWNETDYWYLAMQTRQDQEAWQVVAHRSRDHVVLARR